MVTVDEKKFLKVLSNLSASEKPNALEVYDDILLEVNSDLPLLNDLLRESGHIQTRVIIAKKKIVTIESIVRCAGSTETEDEEAQYLLLKMAQTLAAEIENAKFISSQKSKEGCGYVVQLNPLQLNEARLLVAKYNQCHKLGATILPFRVICEGLNQNIVLFGVNHVDKGLSWLWVTHDHNVAIPEENDLIKFEKLKMKHFCGLSSKKIDSSKVISVYDFSDLVYGNRKEDGVVIHQRLLTCEVKWKNCKAMLSSPPPFDTVCQLFVRGKLGNKRSLIYHLYDELHALEDLIIQPTTKDTEVKQPMLRRMSKFQEDLKTMSLFKGLSDGSRNSMSFVSFLISENPIPHLMTQRQLDLTDLLWNLLKGYCTISAPSCCEAISYLLTKDKNNIKHMIFRFNNTQLAQRIISGQIESPWSMNEAHILEMLIEIGMEKLRRDYTNVFTVSELARKENLDYFLEKTTDNKADLERLKRLHLALETIVICGNALKIELPSLRQLTRQVLEHYQKFEINDDVTVTLPISMDVVQPIWKSHKPVEWQVSFTSSEDNYSKTTSHRVTEGNCPVKWFNHDDQNKLYHYITAEVITDNRLMD